MTQEANKPLLSTREGVTSSRELLPPQRATTNLPGVFFFHLSTGQRRARADQSVTFTPGGDLESSGLVLHICGLWEETRPAADPERNLGFPSETHEVLNDSVVGLFYVYNITLLRNKNTSDVGPAIVKPMIFCGLIVFEPNIFWTNLF